jgi:hypothetical protein
MTEEERNQLNQGFKKITEMLAGAISAIVRSMTDKQQRLEAIKKLKPSNDKLKAVYEVALKNEDYETCEVIKQYFEESKQE